MLKELLQAGNKRRKRPIGKNKTKQNKTIKKMVIGSYISIITFVNGLNAPKKDIDQLGR